MPSSLPQEYSSSTIVSSYIELINKYYLIIQGSFYIIILLSAFIIIYLYIWHFSFGNSAIDKISTLKDSVLPETCSTFSPAAPWDDSARAKFIMTTRTDKVPFLNITAHIFDALFITAILLVLTVWFLSGIVSHLRAMLGDIFSRMHDKQMPIDDFSLNQVKSFPSHLFMFWPFSRFVSIFKVLVAFPALSIFLLLVSDMFDLYRLSPVSFIMSCYPKLAPQARVVLNEYYCNLLIRETLLFAAFVALVYKTATLFYYANDIVNASVVFRWLRALRLGLEKALATEINRLNESDILTDTMDAADISNVTLSTFGKNEIRLIENRSFPFSCWSFYLELFFTNEWLQFPNPLRGQYFFEFYLDVPPLLSDDASASDFFSERLLADPYFVEDLSASLLSIARRDGSEGIELLTD